jgi:nucleoside-triphosphatase THEP1
MNRHANIVVTGDIGCGKSTVAREAMRRLGWERPAGFFTHWDGRGRGADSLWLESWDGERVAMARRTSGGSGAEAPPYALDSARAVAASARALAGAAAGRPVAIDELGRIELASPEFVGAVLAALRAPSPSLVVVQERALEQWIAAGLREVETMRLAVDLRNRDGMAARIADALSAVGPLAKCRKDADA